MSGTSTPPTILVIIGISGDLARRKLLPALIALTKAQKLPEHFYLLGTTRKEAGVATQALKSIANIDVLGALSSIVSLDNERAQDYDTLRTQLEAIEKDFGAAANWLVYVSVPPEAVFKTITHLGESGIAHNPRTKLLLEKPFGSDEGSANALIAHIDAYFSPKAVYRIDHYLAKSMAADVLTFRTRDAENAHLCTNAHVASIDISATELIDIANRGQFYEQTGALRDVVQSHLLAFAALATLDVSDSALSLSERRANALAHLRLAEPLATTTLRGQYEGYTRDVGVEASEVETFVTLTLFSDMPEWIGVPIVITAGKALDAKKTEIRFHSKDNTVADTVFTDTPAEGDGYEKILLHALANDRDLFVNEDEVRASWRIIAPLQCAWTTVSMPLVRYRGGSTSNSIRAQQNNEAINS